MFGNGAKNVGANLGSRGTLMLPFEGYLVLGTWRESITARKSVLSVRTVRKVRSMVLSDVGVRTVDSIKLNQFIFYTILEG